MADFVPVPNSIAVRIQGQHTSGKKVYNVIHTDCGSPAPTLAEVTSAVEAVAQWVVNRYKAVYSSAITINEVRGRSNAEEPGPTYTNNTVSQVGLLAADMVPLSTTCVVNLLTGLTGYSNRGRFFVFPADEASITNGLFTTGYATGCEGAVGFLIAELALTGQALAIESRRHLILRQVTGKLAQIIPSHLASRKVNRGV